MLLKGTDRAAGPSPVTRFVVCHSQTFAMPSFPTSSEEAQAKRWAEYNRAVTLALRDKKTAAEPPKLDQALVLRGVDFIGKMVGASIAEPDLVQRFCVALRSAVGAEFSYMIGFDPDTRTCHTLGGDDLDPNRLVEVFDARYTRGEILESLPMLATGNSAEIELENCTLPIAGIYRGHGFRRVIHLPLVRGHELAGIHLIGRRESQSRFEENARQVLAGATPTASLVLEIDHSRRRLARTEQVSHYLTANISHELRNTFSVILGYGDILRDEARRGGSLEGTNGAMVDRLYTAACEGLEMLRPAFELSDLPYQQTRLTIEDVAISELLEDLVADRFSHQRVEVDMRTDIDPDLPIVATDRTRLRLIVEQILSNAQKFTTAGEVSVTGKVDDQKRVVVTIGDTGPGISRERVAASFDALAEPSSATEGEIPTGLGLYICKQLADRLAAILEIESEIGTGTTVRLTLPTQPPR